MPIPAASPVDAATILDRLPIAAWVTDTAGTIVYRNAMAQALLRGDAAAWPACVVVDDRPVLERLVAAGAGSARVRLHAAAGPMWQEVRCMAAAPTLRTWTAFPVEDIDPLLRDVLDLFPSPALLLEPGTARVLFANRAADTMAGGTFPTGHEAARYHEVYSCTYPDGRRIPVDAMPGVRVARGERLAGFQMDWLTPSGVRSLLLYGDRLPTPCGGDARCLIVFNDITDLQRASRDQTLIAKRFSLLVDQAPFSIQMVGPDGRTTRINGAFYDLWGISLEALADYNLLSDPQLEAAGIAPAIREAFAGGAPQLMPAIPYRPDRGRLLGREIWTQALIYPVKDDDGRVLEVVLVHQDVTEARAREQALRDRSGQLERSNDDLQQFVYVTSHDLQEPLRMVQSFLDLVKRRHAAALPAQARDYIERAASAAGRMHDLVAALLRLTRASETTLQPVAIDVREVIDDVLALLRDDIERSGARIVVDAGPLANVVADRALLATVLQNLISNAVKYRSASPVIVIAATVSAGVCEVRVTDNGLGVPEEARERIFHPFQRLHRDIAGTGIGLALCSRILARHGGSIRVEPNPTGGSVFRFSLPVAT